MGCTYSSTHYNINGGWANSNISRVSCQKGPICHAWAWRVGPFWQDTLDMICYYALQSLKNWTYKWIISLIWKFKLKFDYVSYWRKNIVRNVTVGFYNHFRDIFKTIIIPNMKGRWATVVQKMNLNIVHGRKRGWCQHPFHILEIQSVSIQLRHLATHRYSQIMLEILVREHVSYCIQ